MQPILEDFWYDSIRRRETIFGSVSYQKSNIYGTMAYQVSVVSVKPGGRKRRRLVMDSVKVQYLTFEIEGRPRTAILGLGGGEGRWGVSGRAWWREEVVSAC